MYDDVISKSDDLNDTLSTLSSHLCEFTESTGAYIGQLVKPKLEISEGADDKAHIDEEAIDEIVFVHASPPGSH